MPVSFKSYLKYSDDFTQRGFNFFIQYDSSESLNVFVEDLKFEKDSDSKIILRAFYTNKDENLDYFFKIGLDNIGIYWQLKALTGNHSYGSWLMKKRKLTEEEKNKYGIAVPKLPLPF